MIKNFYMVLVTDEKIILEDDSQIGLSLAMGIISSYLKENNIKTYINDTNKIANNKKYSKEELKIIRQAYDKDRVLNYIKTGNDLDLDKLAKMFLDESWEEYDSYGISIGADFSMLQIHLGIIIATYLKKITKKPVIIGGNNISYLYIFKDFYKELLSTILKKFRYVIKGPGEKVIVSIINSLNNNIPEEKIQETSPGLLRIVHDEIIGNKEEAPIVIKPSWDSLDIDDYSYPFGKSQRENENIFFRFPLALTNKVIAFNKKSMKQKKAFIPYIFNYNCVYSCAFCT